MSWFVVVVSGMMEAVWAVALARSEGFRRVVPSVLFVVFLAGSLGGLAWAMTSLPTGTAYAVWTGIGATLTAVWSMASGAERATAARVGLLVLLVGCVVGLKVVA